MNKRAEKTQEQLEKNAEAVNNIRAAEALLAKVQANIAERQALLVDAKANLQRVALDMANGLEIDGPAELAKVAAVEASLRMAEAALPAAEARLEQAKVDARKNRLAADIALVRKFGRKRIDAAAAITSAIEALDAAWCSFHTASRDLSSSYATKVPPNCLLGADIATSVAQELYRVAPRQPLFGGQREPIPLLPGAMTARLGPARPLSETVQTANDFLVTVLEHGGELPGSHGSTEGKVATDQMVFPADSISARVFGHPTSDKHPGQEFSDAGFAAETDQPLREGQPRKANFTSRATRYRALTQAILRVLCNPT